MNEANIKDLMTSLDHYAKIYNLRSQYPLYREVIDCLAYVRIHQTASLVSNPLFILEAKQYYEIQKGKEVRK